MLVGIESDFNRIKFNYKDINLIVYDFDGVMTDNRAIIFQDGTEAVIVNRADGLGVDRFRSLGISQLILSTETNPVVKARAAKLHLEFIVSCKDKKNALQKYCRKMKYNLSKVAYIGNDINDLEAMKIVGYPIAPADAHVEVKKIAKIITKTIGGDGVIRELLDIFLEDKL